MERYFLRSPKLSVLQQKKFVNKLMIIIIFYSLFIWLEVKKRSSFLISCPNPISAVGTRETQGPPVWVARVGYFRTKFTQQLSTLQQLQDEQCELPYGSKICSVQKNAPPAGWHHQSQHWGKMICGNLKSPFNDELFTRRSSEYHVKLICVLKPFNFSAVI